MTRVGALFVVLAIAAPAAADDTAPADQAAPQQERYAAETIASDVAAIGLAIGGDRSDHPVVSDVGIGLGVAGAPLIHLANRNYRGAAESLALRVTLPLATAWLAEQLAPRPLCACDDNSARIRSSHVLGFAVGLMAVSLIDATSIAKKPAKRSREFRPDLTFANGGMRITVATKW